MEDEILFGIILALLLVFIVLRWRRAKKKSRWVKLLPKGRERNQREFDYNPKAYRKKRRPF